MGKKKGQRRDRHEERSVAWEERERRRGGAVVGIDFKKIAKQMEVLDNLKAQQAKFDAVDKDSFARIFKAKLYSLRAEKLAEKKKFQEEVASDPTEGSESSSISGSEIAQDQQVINEFSKGPSKVKTGLQTGAMLLVCTLAPAIAFPLLVTATFAALVSLSLVSFSAWPIAAGIALVSSIIGAVSGAILGLIIAGSMIKDAYKQSQLPEKSRGLTLD